MLQLQQVSGRGESQQQGTVLFCNLMKQWQSTFCRGTQLPSDTFLAGDQSTTSAHSHQPHGSQAAGGGDTGPIRATPSMWRCSRIMHMQRDIHPTVLSSLEGIVDQVGGFQSVCSTKVMQVWVDLNKGSCLTQFSKLRYLCRWCGSERIGTRKFLGNCGRDLRSALLLLLRTEVQSAKLPSPLTHLTLLRSWSQHLELA